MNIKYFLLTFCFATYSLAAQSQASNETYSVVTVGSSYSESQLVESLEGANLCGFYYQNEKRQLLFEDGSVVELSSSIEHSDVSASCAIQKSPAHKDEFWRISESGHLIRIKQTYGK